MKKKELIEEISRLNKKVEHMSIERKEKHSEQFYNDLDIIESILKRYGDYEHEFKREQSSSCFNPYNVETHIFTLTKRY